MGTIKDFEHDKEIFAKLANGEAYAIEKLRFVELAPCTHIEQSISVHLCDCIGKVKYLIRLDICLWNDCTVIEYIINTAYSKNAVILLGCIKQLLIHEWLNEVIAIHKA